MRDSRDSNYIDKKDIRTYNINVNTLNTNKNTADKAAELLIVNTKYNHTDSIREIKKKLNNYQEYTAEAKEVVKAQRAGVNSKYALPIISSLKEKESVIFFKDLKIKDPFYRFNITKSSDERLVTELAEMLPEERNDPRYIYKTGVMTSLKNSFYKAYTVNTLFSLEKNSFQIIEPVLKLLKQERERTLNTFNQVIKIGEMRGGQIDINKRPNIEFLNVYDSKNRKERLLIVKGKAIDLYDKNNRDLLVAGHFNPTYLFKNNDEEMEFLMFINKKNNLEILSVFAEFLNNNGNYSYSVESFEALTNFFTEEIIEYKNSEDRLHYFECMNRIVDFIIKTIKNIEYRDAVVCDISNPSNISMISQIEKRNRDNYKTVLKENIAVVEKQIDKLENYANSNKLKEDKEAQKFLLQKRDEFIELLNYLKDKQMTFMNK